MKWNKLAKKRMPTHGLKEAWDIRNFYRKVSLPITYVLYHLGFTANMVSILAMVVSIFTGLLIIKGYLILGIALWQLWLILDSVDGEIARLRKSSSASGWFLDLVFENLCFPFNFIALCIWINFDLVGWILAFLWILGIVIRYNYLECLGKNKDEYIRSKDSGIQAIIRYLTYGEFKTVVAFFTLVFALINMTWLFLILLFCYLVAKTILQINILYFSLKRT